LGYESNTAARLSIESIVPAATIPRDLLASALVRILQGCGRGGDMFTNSDIKAHSAWLGIAVAITVSTFVAASAWERVRNKPVERTINVTGSAKKRIVSDQIEWSATITTLDNERIKAVRDLATHMKSTLDYLRAQGIKEAEIYPGSITVEAVYEVERTQVQTKDGLRTSEKKTFKGHQAVQTVTVRSVDVARVERISREITQLLEKGIPVESAAPAYYYTRLGELKIAMLAEASKDARVRAEKMVNETGGAALGRLNTAQMGVININPANSTDTSWEGNNDTTSLEKDIISIVKVTYELK
jgi:hypothetical protein